MSPQGFERVQGLRRVVYDSADYVEGLKAFKEKRKPVYRGSRPKEATQGSIAKEHCRSHNRTS